MCCCPRGEKEGPPREHGIDQPGSRGDEESKH